MKKPTRTHSNHAVPAEQLIPKEMAHHVRFIVALRIVEMGKLFSDQAVE
jgi:hypothetical protein